MLKELSEMYIQFGQFNEFLEYSENNMCCIKMINNLLCCLNLIFFKKSIDRFL